MPFRPPVAYKTLWGTNVPASQQTTPTAFGLCMNHWLTINENGRIVGVRYLQAQNTQTTSGIGFLIDTWQGGNSVVRATAFKRPVGWTSPPANKWQHAYFGSPWRVASGHTLRFGVILGTPFGWYYTDNALAAGPFTNGTLVLPQDTGAQHNGLFQQTATVSLILPNTAATARRFGIDVLFLPDAI